MKKTQDQRMIIKKQLIYLSHSVLPSFTMYDRPSISIQVSICIYIDRSIGSDNNKIIIVVFFSSSLLLSFFLLLLSSSSLSSSFVVFSPLFLLSSFIIIRQNNYSIVICIKSIIQKQQLPSALPASGLPSSNANYRLLQNNNK